MKKILLTSAAIFTLSSFSAFANSEEYKIIIKDHKFTPASLEVPANKKIKLIIDNQDKTAEEFESSALNREKIIPGNKSATIFIGPLKQGTYEYVGEFNEETAKGKIIAK